MKKIVYILIILAAAVSTYVAAAQTKLCRPDGMPDAEAARIVAIATAQGEHFRSEIDAVRARGISLRSDTTYDDVLADTERTLDLARDNYFRRQGMQYRDVQTRVEQGEDLDNVLMEPRYPLKRQQVNYFALALDQSLKDLALAIGAEPVEGSYSYSINPDIFVLALAQFARSAGLKNTGGRVWRNVEPFTIDYEFVETWPVLRTDRLAKIRFSISANLAEMTLTTYPVLYLHYDRDSNRLSDYIFTNRGCLATFTE